jgi:outer membrane protein assembly factor BamB
MATTDCALVALDAASGKEVWAVPIDDYKTGCYSTLAPLAVRGKIILGYSGGELGVRGSVNAFDALTGRRLWKTYTVPGPNEPGGQSWKGEAYKRGGGSTWIMVAAGAQPITWLALAGELQRDWARTEHLGEVAQLFVDYGGATGSAFLWETQLLGTSQGKGA